ncbi:MULTISPECIES: NUDIX hydrolase [Roseobacteraceae]|jgi:8-oxo-dGTP pyrophosphatase MutT (NUDIX family)|uniref:NUDIX domain protein n=1 Tax=Pseudosulfitobacter pseudonitzschiae TaxID=1402135 RepID=A0A221K286_9RHOB|nr:MULTISPECIES: NUDIX hydrolase [Roseobacteraceae]ASM72947.1 NUDIX domain protein [Pseudosulfitobacter pseudonitzschiae]
MTAPLIKQLPISVNGARKSDVRTQFAALCWRVVDGKVQILLITSRGSGRWIVPKGWPMDGQTPGEAALTEAWEEAGVVGKVDWRPVGLFSYSKTIDDADNLPCVAMVYPVRVKSLSKDFPEALERKRRWMSRKKAAQLVEEPELAQIIRDFAPRVLR